MEVSEEHQGYTPRYPDLSTQNLNILHIVISNVNTLWNRSHLTKSFGCELLFTNNFLSLRMLNISHEKYYKKCEPHWFKRVQFLQCMFYLTRLEYKHRSCLLVSIHSSLFIFVFNNFIPRNEKPRLIKIFRRTQDLNLGILFFEDLTTILFWGKLNLELFRVHFLVKNR